MSKWIEGKIIEQKEWAPGLFSVWVDAPTPSFIAGQFTQLSLGGDHKLFRPYSFVNTPFETPLEFYYTLVKTGKFTPQLAALPPGAPIWVAVRGLGKFILADIPSSDILWLFATGTGLGVFLSLLKTREPWERFRTIVLVHSTRYTNELTHLELIRQWQQTYPQRFFWIPTVTRESPLIPEAYRTRITALLQSSQLEKDTHLELSVATSQVMLCGNPLMVEEILTLLQARGLRLNRLREPGHITLENYWK